MRFVDPCGQLDPGRGGFGMFGSSSAGFARAILGEVRKGDVSPSEEKEGERLGLTPPEDNVHRNS